MKLSSAQWEAETCAQASMLMSICRGSRKVLLQRQNGLRGGHCEDRAGAQRWDCQLCLFGLGENYMRLKCLLWC